MPDAAWAVSVHPPSLSRRNGNPPVLTSSNRLSTRHQRFACARLSQSYLPKSRFDFSATFTTIAFDNSSLRWLEITPDCRPRRAFLHLSYSFAPPCGPALLVTQCQQWSSAESRLAAHTSSACGELCFDFIH